MAMFINLMEYIWKLSKQIVPTDTTDRWEKKIVSDIGGVLFVLQKFWSRYVTNFCRWTCPPSCTWWTTRNTAAALPVLNTSCSWLVTWEFQWSHGTRIIRDWSGWVEMSVLLSSEHSFTDRHTTVLKELFLSVLQSK